MTETKLPFNEFIFPIRLWLTFCASHRVPQIVAYAGVEIGLCAMGVIVFLSFVRFWP
jgi:hypothetical protein